MRVRAGSDRCEIRGKKTVSNNNPLIYMAQIQVGLMANSADGPFCDRGGAFALFFFPKDGVPWHQIVGMSILISKKKCFVGSGLGTIRRDAF